MGAGVGGEARRREGGGLYREGDSQVKGAARPIRWLQLITVWLLIVRSPQADLLRRGGGEFDLRTAHPQGDVGDAKGEGENQKSGREDSSTVRCRFLLFFFFIFFFSSLGNGAP